MLSLPCFFLRPTNSLTLCSRYHEGIYIPSGSSTFSYPPTTNFQRRRPKSRKQTRPILTDCRYTTKLEFTSWHNLNSHKPSSSRRWKVGGEHFQAFPILLTQYAPYLTAISNRFQNYSIDVRSAFHGRLV